MASDNVSRFARHTKNAGIFNAEDGSRFVRSYATNVAYIDPETKTVHPFEHYSVTTTRHINYIAGELEYSVGVVGELPYTFDFSPEVREASTKWRG